MFAKKKSYYHIDEVPKKRRGQKKRRKLPLLIAFVLFGAGAYLLVLLQSPDVLPKVGAAGFSEHELTSNNQNFVKIDRLNLLVPFNAGDTPATLEKGAWWRYPERGNPEKGGNFILAGHRFRLGATPNKTWERSPFYRLEEVQEKDIVDVFYNGKWYSYQVRKLYKVAPTDIDIEAPSAEAKLTLYTCSLKGSADGRVVVEAVPYVKEAAKPASDQATPLL